MLRRYRPTSEQIRGTQYSHSHPCDKPTEPAGQTDPPKTNKQTNKKPPKQLNSKQGTEKDTQQRGWGSLSTPENGRGARICSPCEHSVNKARKSSWQASLSTGEGERGSSPLEL
jgi:hypothetical protein